MIRGVIYALLTVGYTVWFFLMLIASTMGDCSTPECLNAKHGAFARNELPGFLIYIAAMFTVALAFRLFRRR